MCSNGVPNLLTLNPDSVSAWISPEHDIWRNGGSKLAKMATPFSSPTTCTKPDGSSIDFMNDQRNLSTRDLEKD